MLYLAYDLGCVIMKTIEWIGSSNKDLKRFPKDVQREIGYALYVAQYGEKHKAVKPLKGYGAGVYEIVSNYNTNAYRAVYIVNIDDKIYVLHAFQKKSKSGIKTPKEELFVIEERLKQVK